MLNVSDIFLQDYFSERLNRSLAMINYQKETNPYLKHRSSSFPFLSTMQRNVEMFLQGNDNYKHNPIKKFLPGSGRRS